MTGLKTIYLSDSRVLRSIQSVVYGALILYFGRDIFMPISFALLVSFVLYPFCSWLERHGAGRFTATLISIAMLIAFGILVLMVLVFQIASFVDEWPSIQTRLDVALRKLTELLRTFGFSKDSLKSFVGGGISLQSATSFFKILRDVISASAFSLVLLILIPVYAFLILYYRKYWMRILARLFPLEGDAGLRNIIELTIKTYYNFIKGMAIVYFVVGSLNSVGLLLLGVPHAILFGFIASILTFVPYVGIIVGALLPIAMAWITYDSIWYPLGVVGVFAFVQYLEANLIFPVAVSSRLNVNTLVMLLAIFAGGILWGVAGMVLFVPYVGIAKLIADHNPKWKTASMILGVETKH